MSYSSSSGGEPFAPSSQKVLKKLTLQDSNSEQNYESDFTFDKCQSECSDFDDRSDACFSRRGPTRSSSKRTFSDEKTREIERENSILMKKILANDQRKNHHAATLGNCDNRVTSNCLNMRRRQREIDYHNLVGNQYNFS